MLKITGNTQNSFQRVDNLKKSLINYLYSKVNISNYTYKILKFKNDLNELLKEKYFVSANFSGTNCFLIFFTYNEKYFSFLVDKKDLSYSVQKLNFDNIKTIPAKLKIDNSIYTGTIFDGIFIQKNKKNKSDMFVITDVYMLKGQNYQSMNINIKMKTIFEFLKNNYDDRLNNELLLSVNCLYELSDINELDDVIPSLEYFVRGYCFYPQQSGRNIIYLFSNENSQDICKNNCSDNEHKNYDNDHKNYDNEHKNYGNIQQNKKYDSGLYKKIEKNNNLSEEEKEKKIIYTPKKDIKKYIFEMKKTEMADVYILYVVKIVKNTKTDKNSLLRVKVDLAYIPNIKKSKWCKDLIVKSVNNSVLVECNYDVDKKKWEPVREVDAKRPSYADDFKIIEIEEN